MNAKLKAKWVEALRSGRYAQAKGRLRSYDNKFCCYGVLCEVAGIPRSKNGYNFGRLGVCETMPLGALRDDLEQDMFDPAKLSTMNDAGRDFPEIASYIEANL